MADKTLSLIANKFATRLHKDRGLVRPIKLEHLRDHVDTLSMSNLDCVQLDILTDMVFSRLTEMDRLYGPVSQDE